MTEDEAKAEAEVRAFFKEHCALDGGVVLVMCAGTYAIFSSYERAMAWLGPAGERPGALIAPYLIDVPDYGTRPSGKPH